jgi:glycosyltransferase involved in cell wall biosynthesis
MPKICIIGPSRKFYSGVSAYTIRLANALATSYYVSVLMIRNLLPKFLYPGKKHVGEHNNQDALLPGISSYNGIDWNSPVSWIRAYRFLKKEKPDVIIMQWWTSSVAHVELFLAVMNRMKNKSSLILEMHELVDPLEASKPFIGFYARNMCRSIISRTDMIIAHSESIKTQIQLEFNVDEKKVFVIPHGVYDIYPQTSTQELARRKLGISEPFVILYFGMIRKYKGVPYLVEAFNRLPESIASNSRLVIAGEDWGDEKGLDTLIKESPRYRNILFKPEFVSDTIVPEYFKAADVVVASLAIAYGKAIIISDLEHTRESLKNYEGAIFVPSGNSARIASILAEFYAQRMDGNVFNYSVPAEKKWEYIRNEFEKVIERIKK